MDIPYSTLERYLKISSLIYLSIPIAIFFVGWLKWPVLGFVGILLGILFWKLQFSRRRNRAKMSETVPHFSQKVSVLLVVLGLIPAILLTGLSGAGGWGFQEHFDWGKHNRVLQDLIDNPWPVIYEHAQGRVMMVYYLAYYLPAAVMGKCFGWTTAHQMLFVMTLIGVILCVLWVMCLTRAHPILCGLVFVLFSGMDVIGSIFMTLKEWDHWENWSQIGQYSSTPALLFFVPNQALGGWLTTALFCDGVFKKTLHRSWIFLLAVSSLWATLATIGLIPLIVVMGIIGYFSSEYRLREMVSLLNITGIIIGGVVFVYLYSRIAPYPLPADTVLARGEFGMNGHPHFIRQYLLFIVLEFLLLAVVIYPSIKKPARDHHKSLQLFFLINLVLLGLPFLRYGAFNDLVMRSSIPALFILSILTITAIQILSHQKLVSYRLTAIVCILALGSMTSVIEIRRHVREISRRKPYKLVGRPPYLNARQLVILDMGNLIAQYIGATDSLFGTYLAKNNPMPPSHTSPPQPGDQPQAKVTPLSSPLASMAGGNMFHGGYGIDRGQFNEPRGIAINHENHVYVADFRNQRIQKFSQDGTFLLAWGQYGDGPGQFKDPCDVTVDDDGYVYVADTYNQRIQKFTSDGVFLKEWGHLDMPRGIDAGPDGLIYVTNTGSHMIKVFDSEGTLLKQFGKPGRGDSHLLWPIGIDVHVSGTVFVADTGNARIQMIGTDGCFIGNISIEGAWKGDVYVEPYITLLLNDDILATDPTQNAIYRLNQQGEVLKTFKLDKRLLHPMGIVSTPEGQVYVVDTHHHRIQDISDLF